MKSICLLFVSVLALQVVLGEGNTDKQERDKRNVYKSKRPYSNNSTKKRYTTTEKYDTLEVDPSSPLSSYYNDNPSVYVHQSDLTALDDSYDTSYSAPVYSPYTAPATYTAPAYQASYVAPAPYAAPTPYAAPAQYAAPTPYAAPAPYAAPTPYAAPAPYAAPTPYAAPAPYAVPAPYAAPAPAYQAQVYQPQSYSAQAYQSYQSYQPAYSPQVSYAKTSYYAPTQYNDASITTWEQWCTDACAYRAVGGPRNVNPNYSPKTANFPTNYGTPQDLDDNNCHCFCPVPPQQDPENSLCSTYGENYNACADFCSGNNYKQIPITTVGTLQPYLQGGTCLDDPTYNTRVCNCHCKVYDIPM